MRAITARRISPLLLPLLGVTGCGAGSDPTPAAPAAGSRQAPLIGGAVLPRAAWESPSDARVAKLLAGTGKSGACSAVPLAGKWLLSARHCWYGPEKTATTYPDGARKFAPGPATQTLVVG